MSALPVLESGPGMSIRILYIEDDPFALEQAEDYFRREARDFKIDAAHSASAGRKLLKQKEYDVLLVDFTLPDGNALDIIRDVHSAGLILPIAVVTGNDQEELLVTVLRAGASDYVVKRGNYVSKLPAILRNLAEQYRFRRKIFSRIPARTLTILYADTNESDLEATRNYFEHYMVGFQWKEVRSADEVLKTLSADPGIALVISELRIPNMSALELIRSCRHQGINVPFIVLTSEAEEGTAVAALKLGAFDYIIKRESYLGELAHSAENAIYRSQLDALSLNLYSEIEKANSSLEEKVRERTAQLQNEVELRRESERQLTDAIRQKDILLMEIHHRVKNNLQIVASLINLQLRSIEDSRNRELLRTLASRVQAMAMVHQALYNSSDFEKLNFSNHLEALSTALFDSYGVDRNRIRFELDCPDLLLDINTSIPLSLVVNEILSNSLKHAFADGRGGLIRISGKKNGRTVSLQVMDDGAGMPEELSEKTLGLKLIELLVRQLDGQIKVDRDKGTRYTIVLQLPGAAEKKAQEKAFTRAHG